MFKLQSKSFFNASRQMWSMRHFSEDISWTKRQVEAIKRGSKNIKSSCKILWNDGKFTIQKKYQIYRYQDNCTYEESKLMAKTNADLLKMIPFSLFIIIPFAEFTLPVFLYVFPNMIPSVFLGSSKKDEFWKNIIESRAKNADKLHIYMLERIKSLHNPTIFFEKLNKPYDMKIEDFQKNHEMLESALNFENMSTDMLKATCRFLGMEPYTGFNALSKIFLTPLSKTLGNWLNIPKIWDPKITPLRQIQRNFVIYQLRKHAQNLRAEDKLLLAEDIDKLKLELLIIACRERAIDTVNNSDLNMRKQLKEWIYYSTLNKDPIKYETLVFSQIFKYLNPIPAEDIKKAIKITLEKSIDKVFHYDKNIDKIIEKIEANGSKITDDERKVIKDKLEKELNDELIAEKNRIDKAITNLVENQIEPISKAEKTQSSATKELKEEEISVDIKASTVPYSKPLELLKPNSSTIENSLKADISKPENSTKSDIHIGK